MVPFMQGGTGAHRLPADGGGRVAALGKQGVLVPEYQVADLAGRVVLQSPGPGSRPTVSRACNLVWMYIKSHNNQSRAAYIPDV